MLASQLINQQSNTSSISQSTIQIVQGHSLSQLNSQSISQSAIQIVSQWVNPLSPNNHTQILQSDRSPYISFKT